MSMKGRKKLLLSLAFLLLSGLAYRLALHQKDLVTGNIFIVLAIALLLAALTIFAIYFRE